MRQLSRVAVVNGAATWSLRTVRPELCPRAREASGGGKSRGGQEMSQMSTHRLQETSAN